MSNAERLLEQVRDHFKSAQAIASKAESEKRDLTPAELAGAEKHLKDAKALKAQADAEQVKSTIGGIFGPSTPVHPGNARVNALGGSEWGKALTRSMSDSFGNFKSLTPGGQINVTVPLAPEPIRTAEPVLALRQVIPTEQNITGQYAYLRQTARSNAAAAVAPGALKPESTYTLTRVDDRVRTLAHLSEPIPRQDLSDAVLLESFVDTELRLGLELELEDQILNGDSTGENFTGLANTSGIQTVAWATDALTTCRKGITALEVISLSGTAFVFSPSDWEMVELEAAAQFASNSNMPMPVDRVARRLWGVPVVLSTSVAVGTGYLADFTSSTRLHVREEAAVDWSENIWRPDALGTGVGASDFQRNLITFRCEMRAGLAVTRPTGVVQLDLTSGA